MRLISFVLLSLMIVCSLGLSILLTWSALALLLWNVFRARRAIYACFHLRTTPGPILSPRNYSKRPPREIRL